MACWRVLLLLLLLQFTVLLCKADGDVCTAAHPFNMGTLTTSTFPIASERALVIAYQSIPCDGVVNTWSAVVRGNLKLSFLIWERNGTVFTLVGRNDFTVMNSNDSRTTNFVPSINERIAVRTGQILGLYTSTDGIESGVKAVQVTPASDAVFEFVQELDETITTIDISEEGIRRVPDVRPLVSAVIGPDDTSETTTTLSPAISPTAFSPHMPISASSILSSTQAFPSTQILQSTPHPLTTTPSQTTTYAIPTSSVNPANSVNPLSSVTPTSSQLPMEIAIQSNLPILLSVTAGLLVVTVAIFTAGVVLGIFIFVRRRKQKNLPTNRPIRVLPGLDNNIYMQHAKEDNDYDVVTHQQIEIASGESSPSLSNSCASSISIKKHAVVQHQYAACGPSEYLQPVSLNGTPTTSIQRPPIVSAVYDVPIVVVNKIAGKDSADTRIQSAGYETPVDGMCVSEASNSRHNKVTSVVYDTPPDATVENCSR